MDSYSTPNEKKIIQFNESAIKDHLGEMVRSTVEETLNQMLDDEADHLCNAEKYQCSEVLMIGHMEPFKDRTLEPNEDRGYGATS